MTTGSQIRAARALVDWSSDELAKNVGVSGVTIRNIETGISKRPQTRIIEKIEAVLNAAGVEFTDHDGVRRVPSGYGFYRGQDRFNDFMDYLLNDVREHGGEVVVSLNDERIFQKHIHNIENFRSEMMALDKAGKIKGRILATQGNFVRTWADLRRAPSGDAASTASFYVFNDNLALVSFTRDIPSVALVKDKQFADDFRRLFNLMWNGAEEL